MTMLSPTARLLYMASSSEMTQISSLVPSSNIAPSTMEALPLMKAVMELSLLYPMTVKSPDARPPPIMPPIIPPGKPAIPPFPPSRLPSSVPSEPLLLSSVSSLTGERFSEPFQ